MRYIWFPGKKEKCVLKTNVHFHEQFKEIADIQKNCGVSHLSISLI